MLGSKCRIDRRHFGILVSGLLATCGSARAGEIVVTTGGSTQQKFSFHNSERKQFDYNVKDYSKDFYLPLGTELVEARPRYTRKEHVIDLPEGAAPGIRYILRNGGVTNDIKKAAGVRLSVRLEASPKVKLIGIPPFQKPDPRFVPYDGILEGTITLSYKAGKSSTFITHEGSRFVQGAGKWTEHRANGSASTFDEVNRPSPNSVELYDGKRKMFVLLTQHRAFWREKSSDSWKPWHGSEGYWKD